MWSYKVFLTLKAAKKDHDIDCPIKTLPRQSPAAGSRLEQPWLVRCYHQSIKDTATDAIHQLDTR